MRMRQLLLAGTGAFAVFFLSGCDHFGASQDGDGRDATPLQRLAANAIGPAYEHWQESSHALAETTDNFCAGDAALDVLREAWRNDVLAWSALQSMQPGPVTPVSVRVSYWPDKKDLVGHQVRQWLAEPAPTPEQLADASVTLQGLSALEFVLFDPAVDLTEAAQRERYCGHLRAIAGRQAGLATETLQEWQKGQGKGLMDALPNARYADEKEALAELLKANVGGLEAAHKKLVEPLGDKHPQPYLAEYWRSGESLPAARAVLEGSRTLWKAGLEQKVAAVDEALAARISALYQQLLDDPLLAVGKAPMLAKLLADSDGRAQLRAFTGKMKSLHMAYASDVSKALQVSLGINAHDGD